MSRRPLLAALLVCLLAPCATAGTLDFDELPAVNANGPGLSDEYAALGIHFHTSDDGSSWDGLSRGDPGAWGIEGVNGSAFIGFNGASYGMGASFDAPIRDVQLDVANSLGAQPGSQVTLEGYRQGMLVGRHELILGHPGEWTTASVVAEVDSLHIAGAGEGYHPFAIDNLRWEAAEEPFDVDIEITPGARAPLDLSRHGLVGVAIYGSSELDVDGIEETSLAVGPWGAQMLLSSLHFTDLDEDGWIDLVGLYAVSQTGVSPEDVDLCVLGETVEGWPFEGCLAIETVAAQD